jgi:hypothetical protein
MRIKKTKVMLFAFAAGLSTFALSSAKAQNSNYTPGDLVLAFQQEGGSNTVYVGLGNTATVFRGAATGADVANMINIININAELTAAFGANWATNVDLYAGLSGVWGTAGGLNNSLQNGDPNRTLYVSQARAGVGTVGQANSTTWSIINDGGMSSGASGMTSQNNVFYTQYTTQAAVSPVGVSQIDVQNPFLAENLQGTAFGTFAGGVQQVGSAGSFGSFGPVENVEFALDLYRIQARNNIAGQFGFGDTNRLGTYEGTIVVDSAGNVSFITAVPEPTTSVLLAGGLTMLMTFRRRSHNRNA